MEHLDSTRRRSIVSRARRDLIAIGVVVLLLCGAVAIDPDGLFEWLAKREVVQFDESLVAVVVIGVGFALYSWRRWADLGRQVAEYQRVQKELGTMHREASRLSETDDLLQSCIAAAEAYEVVIRHIRSELPSSSGAICATTAARDMVEVRAQWGSPALADTLFAPKDCWALRRGRVNIARAGDSRLACAHIGPQPPAYALCVPMVAQGETLGVLYLDSGTDHEPTSELSNEISEAQERMVKTLAEHLALAVANLNLRESLRLQSIRDPLTALFNRRYMEESLERELRRSSRKEMPLSVLMVDVDHFKKFNDSLGHEAGDLVLQELAALFGAQLRAEDIACRYGGEEFTLILPETPLASAQERADQLCRLTRTTDLQYRGRSLPRVTISIGVSCHPQHGVTRDSLLQAADQALYRAKEDGRDRVVLAQETRRA